jgi:hypothetical protein
MPLRKELFREFKQPMQGVASYRADPLSDSMMFLREGKPFRFHPRSRCTLHQQLRYATQLYKHKLLLDEHLYHWRAYPTLNEYFEVKHIKDDLHHDGMVDSLIYELAVSTGRIILTSNIKDFRPLLQEDSPEVSKLIEQCNI